MRLIDADEAIINFGFEWDDICPTRDEVVSFLRKQKTIDDVPTVRGEWDFLNDYESRCTACGESSLIDHGDEYKYCPNCGAKMESEAQ